LGFYQTKVSRQKWLLEDPWVLTCNLISLPRDYHKEDKAKDQFPLLKGILENHLLFFFFTCFVLPRPVRITLNCTQPKSGKWCPRGLLHTVFIVRGFHLGLTLGKKNADHWRSATNEKVPRRSLEELIFIYHLEFQNTQHLFWNMPKTDQSSD
jgi:hypothetical protein